MTKQKEEELMEQWLKPFGEPFDPDNVSLTKEEKAFEKECLRFGDPFDISKKERDRLGKMGVVV